MKRMLINATQAEELRVAIADGQKLVDLDIETPAHEQKKANVYKARITRVEHSLEACFVDYGSERHGFLPFKEINVHSLTLPSGEKVGDGNLRDLLKEGMELIVQVEKEERGTKGAALSTYISLAGRYSVLMPNSPKSGGVSRRISGEERDEVRSVMEQLNIPEGMGLIIRTAGVGRAIEELQWDLDYLLQLWAAIEKAIADRKAPFLIYQESNLIIRALRDYLRDDINEILIDSDDVYQNALEFMQLVMPHNLRKLKHYKLETPLFTRYQIESQIETAFAREVTLPSGGSLVIDHTEALLSIDINSARATKGTDIEDTALHTNLEAADEIARQLRIRDLGGLVVIDFIDMSNRSNQRKVQERMRDALSQDRARIQIGRISKFGLLEMSRQRMRPSIGESSYQVCPRCIGHGSIRSVESLALSMLRLIEEEAIKDFTGQILAQAPIKVANFLHNEKREAILTIEKRHEVPILIIANTDMQTPRFEIKRLRTAEISADPSYLQINHDEGELVANDVTKAVVHAEKPAVSGVRAANPAPPPTTPQKEAKKAGFWSAVVAFFSSSSDNKAAPKRKKTSQKPNNRRGGKKTHAQRNRNKQRPRDNRKENNPNQANSGRPTTHKKASKKVGKKAGKKGHAKKAAHKNATEANPTAQNTTEQAAQNAPRRRGKRGGRKRRSHQKGDTQNNNQGNVAQPTDNTNSPNGNQQPQGNQVNSNQVAQNAPAPAQKQQQQQQAKHQPTATVTANDKPATNTVNKSEPKPKPTTPPRPQPVQTESKSTPVQSQPQQKAQVVVDKGTNPAATAPQPKPGEQQRPAPKTETKPVPANPSKPKAEAPAATQVQVKPKPPVVKATPAAVKGLYSLSGSGSSKPQAPKPEVKTAVKPKEATVSNVISDKPAVVKPTAAKPKEVAVSNAISDKPAVVKPVDAKPKEVTAGNAISGKPAVVEPAAVKPKEATVSNAISDKPAVVKPAAVKPKEVTVSNAISDKAAVVKPATVKPASTNSEGS